MATLEKIRNKAGLLVGIVGVALFAFIIGDFLNSGSTFFRQNQENVLVVNGTRIPFQEYQRRIDEMEQVAELQMGRNALPEEYRTQIRQNVYNTSVEELLLAEELDKLGMAVTADEIFDMMQGENISPMLMQNQMFLNSETGAFDKNGLLNFLKMTDEEAIMNAPAEQQAQLVQLRTLRLYLEKMIKLQRQEQKFITLLSKAISTNKVDARNSFDAQATNSDIIYVMQPYASIPDSSISVNKSEIEKLYNQRKNAYKQAEAKVIKYIMVNIAASQEDYDKAKQEINLIKNELAELTSNIKDFVADYSDVPYEDVFRSTVGMDEDLKQFVTTSDIGDIHGPFLDQTAVPRYRLFKLIDKTFAPDSVYVCHIMLPNDGHETILADSLLEALKKGSSFAELAAVHSIDRNSSSNSGEMGWMTEEIALSVVSEEFNTAVFSARQNEPFKFKSLQGTHILKVTARTTNIHKYKVAVIDKSVNPSSKTYGDLYNNLNKFISRNRDINKLDTAAQNAGLTIFSNVSVSMTDEMVAAIPQSRRIVRWVFEHKGGDISEIFDCDSKHFVVAAVQGSVRKGFRSISSMEDALKAELIAKKKGELIANDLKSKKLTTLEAYARTMNAQVDSVKFINFNTPRITNIGIEPKLNALTTLAPLNTVSSPVAGNNGVYVFEVFNRANNGMTYDERMQMEMNNAGNMYKYGYQSMQLLINNANIEDNRLRFY
ncbi:MAG: SurA N-terminal domain-containing protein [Tannerellaceae bacterium]|jgi:peptidyl-prolyl cis-trans isomerase D|nr:SurA N-terminal domain-containing protein [Tannerellaceae bacterium]